MQSYCTKTILPWQVLCSKEVVAFSVEVGISALFLGQAGQGFDEEHSSLVQLAALSGDAKAVRLLVQLGCDVNQHNKFGIPPSFSALMR